ncbi:MAG: hypothetical protein GY859_12900 [Desulfobacterales bacterium]|nr:hypothetical protein [Desulfobacterales bacterium]
MDVSAVDGIYKSSGPRETRVFISRSPGRAEMNDRSRRWFDLTSVSEKRLRSTNFPGPRWWGAHLKIN